MTNFNPTSLEYDWRYFPPEDFDPSLGSSELDESSWGVLNTLSDWPQDLLYQADAVYLSRVFNVEPIADVCARFLIYVPAAPEGTTVFVNGWLAGVIQNGQELVADATDHLMLEGNQILVTLSARGDLYGIQLQPVPCEDG